MSENQNRGIGDLSKYDEMTTEELEEILRIAFWSAVFFAVFGLVIGATYVLEWIYTRRVRVRKKRRPSSCQK